MRKFTPEQVFGLVAAAHRINEGYLKEPLHDFSVQPPVLVKEANKVMIRQWINADDHSQVTPEDITKGIEVRRHFRAYMLLALSDKLNDFQRSAYKVAEKEEWTDRDAFDLAIVSCLISVQERDIVRKIFNADLSNSVPLPGKEGDRVAGEVIVTATRYNPEFSKYKIQGKMNNSYVNFWYKEDLQGTVEIKGLIKRQNPNKITSLNYVKVTGKKLVDKEST